MTFKTIEQCRLDLVAHSVSAYRHVGKSGGIGHFEEHKNLDDFPASAARVSFGNEDKTGDNPEADLKLMKYLAKHQHMSPFEHQSATFLIECPLFIRSQIHRHRTFSYNEISRRYTEENLEFWHPGEWRKQAENNRQASSNETVSDSLIMGWNETRKQVDPVPISVLYQNQVGQALDLYKEMLAAGVAREQARTILPQSLLTKFYMTGNLRNWVHFVKLRTHEGAQQEVMVVANRISDQLRTLWPTAWGVLMDEV